MNSSLRERTPDVQEKVAAFTKALDILNAEQWFREQESANADTAESVKLRFHRELLGQVERLLDARTIAHSLDSVLLDRDDDAPDLTAWAVRIREAAEVAHIDLKRIIQLVRSEQ